MTGYLVRLVRAPAKILLLLLTMYNVAALSTQQTLQQVPFSTYRVPFGDDGYTYSLDRWFRGSRVLGDTYEMNVGDNADILYTLTVYDESGTVICHEDLMITEPPVVEPPDFVFSSSLYTAENGSVTPNFLLPSNPFKFVPWYGGDAEVSVEGYACTDVYPYLIESTDTLRIKSAAVQPDMDPAMTFCPALPEVLGDELSNTLRLQWSKNTTQSCQFAFDIQNNLDRSASFGIIQIVQNAYKWITIDDTNITITGSAGAALLDLESATGPIAVQITEGDISSGINTTLMFDDAPSTMIGSGCWTSPSDPIKAAYFSIGFTYSFQTFVMQDWDKTGGGERYQVPIGGQSVLEWTLTARADWMETSGTFEVNGAASNVVGPSIAPQSASFDPLWSGNTLENIQRSATFNRKTGCYDFAEDPVPPILRRQRKSRRMSAESEAGESALQLEL